MLGKELPVFNGNPEDWPLFVSSFEQSTIACGYTDAENLIRLQRCLRGHALEAVRSRLLLPTNVPYVIQTLRTLYGRPELLIRSLLAKIQRVPPPRQDRLETLMEFGLAVQNLVDHLVGAQQENHLSNPVLLQELVEKLPGSLKLNWAVYKRQDVIVTLATFGSFMSELVSAASEVTMEIPVFSRAPRNEHQRSREKGFLQTHSSRPLPSGSSTTVNNGKDGQKPGKTCSICTKEGHRVGDCTQYNLMTVEERWSVVQKKGLCRTCLNNHGKWPCKSWKGCGVSGCTMKHHTSLHIPSAGPPSVNVSTSHFSSNSEALPLFRIQPVVLFANGLSLTVFAFIDEGSSLTLLEADIAEQLGVCGPKEPLTLLWTGNVSREESKAQRIELEIASAGSQSPSHLMQTHTVNSLVLPTQTLRYQDLSARFPHLRGLPIEEYENVQPKLLIGINNLHLSVPLKIREGAPRDPIAAKCRLGWGIYGCAPRCSPRVVPINFHIAAASDSDRELNEQLRDYFAVESIGTPNSSTCVLESEENRRARTIMEETTRRTSSGFETGLLWRMDDVEFPESHSMAVRRLQSLERKLEQDSFLRDSVRQLIWDYERKGYAHKATMCELDSMDSNRMWFLPLGVVRNPKKPQKIRLIWDAAAKSHGVSFNSKLLKGPNLLIPLVAVLSRFRQYPVAVCIS